MLNDSKYDLAVEKARELLIKQRRDETHDLSHHERVWNICRQIVEKERISINFTALKVAVFWHDVVVGEEKWPSILMVEETCEVLKEVLSDLKFSDKEVQIITEAVLFHEFRSSPRTIEGLVLQDADKLDVLSKERWTATLNSYRKGEYSKQKLISYVTTFLNWVPILSATFHYDFSKKISSDLILDFWKDLKWRNVIEELGLKNEYQVSRRNMSSIKTNFLRFFITWKNYILKMKILINIK